eukprot:210648-Chlamydomonas_euryale.AAC.2
MQGAGDRLQKPHMWCVPVCVESTCPYMQGAVCDCVCGIDALKQAGSRVRLCVWNRRVNTGREQSATVCVESTRQYRQGAVCDCVCGIDASIQAGSRVRLGVWNRRVHTGSIV